MAYKDPSDLKKWRENNPHKSLEYSRRHQIKINADPILKERDRLQNAINHQRTVEKLKQEGTTLYYKRDKPRAESSWESFVKFKVGHAKQHSVRNKCEFSISPEFVMDLLVKQDYKCAIMRWPLEHVTKSPASLSIDRVDSNKGYVEGNIQLVSAFANLGKRGFEQKEIIKYLTL